MLFKNKSLVKYMKEHYNDPDINEVKKLISAGASIDAKIDGMTPLMYATGGVHIEIVQLLVDLCANLDVVNAHGQTAIMLCSSKESDEHMQILNILIRAGADINIKNRSGNTVLLDACHWGEDKTIKVLAKAKNIDFDIEDIDGYTALMCESKFGRPDTVKALVKNGVSIDKESSVGYTALGLAIGQYNKCTDNESRQIYQKIIDYLEPDSKKIDKQASQIEWDEVCVI